MYNNAVPFGCAPASAHGYFIDRSVYEDQYQTYHNPYQSNSVSVGWQSPRDSMLGLQLTEVSYGESSGPNKRPHLSGEPSERDND